MFCLSIRFSGHMFGSILLIVQNVRHIQFKERQQLSKELKLMNLMDIGYVVCVPGAIVNNNSCDYMFENLKRVIITMYWEKYV